MKIKNVINFLVAIAVIAIVGSITHEEGYNKGRSDGFGLGVEVALDTVKQILFKQTESDTTITKLTFEKDTVSYFVSKKMLVEKFSPK